jgi:hypothetical protein
MVIAHPGDQIWVKKGRYVPSGSTRSASFRLKNGVEIYGGFGGTETLLSQRDPQKNLTVLSGDRNADDASLNNKSDNAYHVVTASEVDGTTILDGFMITGGYADGVDWPDYNGGGIFNYAGSPTLNNLFIASNYASNGGGGMINDSVTSINMNNLTFSNNTANGVGGGGLINWLSQNVSLFRSSFSGNNTNGDGGAIFNAASSTATIAESTIRGNYANTNGGGLNNQGTVFMRNTIISSSYGGDCVGTLDPSSANNLISDTDSATNCGLSGPSAFGPNSPVSAGINGNIVGVDPMLGPLTNNGGLVPTFALLAGSPAIDAGDMCPSFDQRGQLPKLDGDGDGTAACDIGAFEVSTAVTPTLLVPVDAEILFSSRPTFDWLDYPGAIGYNIQVSKTANFASTSLVVNVNLSGATNSQYAPTKDLTVNTTLYWRVRAKLTGTTYSSWSTARTLSSANPPGVPTLASPANAALVAGLSPLFNWSDAKIPAGVTFDHYQLQVAKDNAFIAIVHDVNISGVANSQDNTAVLNPATTYYWRVRSFAADGDYSAWSTVWSVKTKYAVPVLSTPGNGATAVALKPSFSWNLTLGATSYTIQISKKPTFGLGSTNATVAVPAYSPGTNLSAATTYYWHVKINGPFGPSDWSATFSFVTQ